MTTIPDDHPIRQVRDSLARTALRLMDALDDESIAAAPLNQRAAALGIVLDRLLKVEQQHPAPSSEPQENVYRVEYLYPDGSIHDSPPWARRNSERGDALPGSGLRAALRQDGSRQNLAD